MEGKFTNFMIEELKTLVMELEEALQPSNMVLYQAAMIELRSQYKDHSDVLGEDACSKG